MPFRKLINDQYIAQPPRGAPKGAGRINRKTMRAAFRQAFDALRGPRRRLPAPRPVPTPRPRERGARMVVASGRSERGPPGDGDSDGGGGGGGGEPPPPPPYRSEVLFSRRRS